jgi:hypothetical protein
MEGVWEWILGYLHECLGAFRACCWLFEVSYFTHRMCDYYPNPMFGYFKQEVVLQLYADRKPFLGDFERGLNLGPAGQVRQACICFGSTY